MDMHAAHLMRDKICGFEPKQRPTRWLFATGRLFVNNFRKFMIVQCNYLSCLHSFSCFIIVSYYHVLTSSHISSTTKFGLWTQYLWMWLHWIKSCVSVMWCHSISTKFQLSAVQSFNESHVSEAGENGCYLSVLVSVSHLQIASSLELFSNQK
jgi:hypothetical protein